MEVLFSEIGKLIGTDNEIKFGVKMKELGVLSNAYLLVQDGVIAEIGEGLPAEIPENHIKLNGAEVLPGFVDSHTHLIFAKPRYNEFVLKIKGATYEEIAAAGGGILNSAKILQGTPEDQLFDDAKLRVESMIQAGTTAIEIKSGYGLTPDAELKMLRVVKRLKEYFPIIIRSTFLGAHAIPVEYKNNTDEYVDIVINQMLPEVAKESLADHIDVFCDTGFFTPEQTDKILKAAIKFQIPAKIHGNELGLTGGVQVAVENEAWSVDHLEHLGSDEIACLKDSFNKQYGGTMPVALPGTSYFLRIPYSDARTIIDNDLPLVLATDYNPGSSPVHSLQTISALACTYMRILPEEVFHAITINAARALRMESLIGSFTVGKRADFLVMKNKDSLYSMPYYLGQNQVSRVFVEGLEIK